MTHSPETVESEAMTNAADGFDVRATRSVPAEVADVFAFLADLENHWLLADRFVEVVELSGPPGGRTGGRVRVRGPLGVRRTATIRIDVAAPTNAVRGSAAMSGGTLARICWLLRPVGRHTVVTLGATIESARPFDRLLLRAGGLVWMTGRFAGALEALEESLAPAFGVPPA